jgi:hypothetical protein
VLHYIPHRNRIEPIIAKVRGDEVSVVNLEAVGTSRKLGNLLAWLNTHYIPTGAAPQFGKELPCPATYIQKPALPSESGHEAATFAEPIASTQAAKGGQVLHPGHHECSVIVWVEATYGILCGARV